MLLINDYYTCSECDDDTVCVGSGEVVEGWLFADLTCSECQNGVVVECEWGGE